MSLSIDFDNFLFSNFLAFLTEMGFMFQNYGIKMYSFVSIVSGFVTHYFIVINVPL